MTRTARLRDPAAIVRRSFEIVRRETDFSGLPADLTPIAERLVHACGMPDIAGDLAHAGGVAAAARDALTRGAPILADGRMTAAGIVRDRLPAGNRVLCMLDAAAAGGGTTRSAAAVDLWRPHLDGAVVAIGNAPTALFRLLELLAAGAPRPAAIFAFPVGFVGAAESKQALCEPPAPAPFLTLLGRRGGSALAAAAVNAVCAGGEPPRTDAA